MTPFIEALACIGLTWGVAVIFVQGIGIYQIFRFYSSVSGKPVSPDLPDDEVPHITLIRPAKGLEPGLYECLASSFHQAYPRGKLTIYLCASSKDDPAYPTLCRLVADYPGFDAKVYVEAEDPHLNGAHGDPDNVGPNPKIRNVSRAYREAKGDVIWIVDCNVWIDKGVAGRMVDRLYGFRSDSARTTPFKFVHQLPLVVDTVSSMSHVDSEGQSLLSNASVTGGSDTQGSVDVPTSVLSRSWVHGGGRLEEMFMATTHAKFYGAINTVGVAPCVVGKSNMFRKSHLEQVTDPDRNPLLTGNLATLPKGIDHFAAFMCEDHCIGDLLWKSDLPGFANHAVLWGNLVVQPIAGMSVSAYVSRRVRWLRARKWTVLAATLVEHGVESLVCWLYISFGLTTIPRVSQALGIPQTWPAFWLCWICGVASWMLTDRVVFGRLHAGRSIDVDENTPAFARGTARGGAENRPFGQWYLAWLGRECLALPIWTWAVLLGANVNWRGREFRVRSDMTVVAVDERDVERERERERERGSERGPVRAKTKATPPTGKID